MVARVERRSVDDLIEICRDGARGFQLAANSVSDPELKRIFGDAGKQREVYRAELLPFAVSLNAEGSTRAALHRRWMEVRERLKHDDDAAVLAEAIRGESAAAAAYAKALAGTLLPKARPIVQRQHDELCGVLRELTELSLPCS